MGASVLNRGSWYEAAQLLAACHAPHVRLFVALGLYTAARTGALLSLTWGRVDLARGMINLGDAMGNKKRATVPIPDALRPHLLEARSGATCDFVVSMAVGAWPVSKPDSTQRLGGPGWQA